MSRHGGSGYAMAREPLGVPEVVTDPAKIRHAIECNSHCAAPSEFNCGPLKLWIDFEHMRSHEGSDISGETAGVVFAAAKYQPTVLR